MTARTPQRQQLMELLGPVIISQGYELEDVSVTSAGRRSLIRVIVDGDDGIDLDGVADVSRAVSDVLDGTGDSVDSAAFAGPYVLEVSSPGVDRPLTEPRHWRRATGRLVKAPSGDRVVTGRIVSADDQQVTLRDEHGDTEYRYAELGAGRIEVEFSRPGEPAEEADRSGADHTEVDADGDDRHGGHQVHVETSEEA